MRYIENGTNNQKLSEIVLGLMRIDSLSTEKASVLLDTALEAGINMIDLADIYGGDGLCEEIVGDIFKNQPSLRDKFYVQTKCGIRFDGGFTWFDNSGAYLRESVEEALRRLNVDHIDCMMLHRPDALTEPEETAEVMNALRKEGKVIDFGVSNHNVQQIKRLKRFLDFPIAANQVQLSCAFTPMLDAGFHVNMQWDGAIMREDGILEYCQRKEIAVQTWSSLQYGYFEGTFLGAEKYEDLNRVLKEVADETSSTPMAVAIAWLLRLPGKMQSVIGTTKPERVKEAVQACSIVLDRSQWYRIYLAAGNVLP